jgi:hypothetical protein
LSHLVDPARRSNLFPSRADGCECICFQRAGSGAFGVLHDVRRVRRPYDRRMHAWNAEREPQRRLERAIALKKIVS